MSDRYFNKLEKILGSVNSEKNLGEIFKVMGFITQFKGEYAKSLEYFSKSIELFDLNGDIPSSLLVRIGLIDSYHYQANHYMFEKLLNPYIDLVEKYGDYKGIALKYNKLAAFAFEKGEFQEAVTYGLECSEYSRDKQSLNNLCWAEAILGAVFIEQKQYDNAINHLTAGIDLHKKNSTIGQYSVWNYPLYAEALMGNWNKRSNNDIVRIKKACKIALKMTKPWLVYHGVSLRVYAKYLVIAGKNKKAEKYFIKSIDLFKRIDRKFELALSYREYGYFLTRINQNDSALIQLNRAWKIFNEINSGFKNRIENFPGCLEKEECFVDSFVEKQKSELTTSLIEELYKCNTLQEINDFVVKSSMKIAGAEGGGLFLSKNSSPFLTLEAKSKVSGCGWIEYSQNIVDQVYNTGETIISSFENDNSRQKKFENSLSKSVKSIICVPVKINNQIEAVCYLFNNLSTGVFTINDELHLKKFLSNASIAMENKRLKKTVKVIDEIKSEDEKNKSLLMKDDLNQIIEYIQLNYTCGITREKIADTFNLSPSELGTQFKLKMNLSLKDYINQLKIKHAYQLLIETDYKIIDIAFEAGFESLRTFNRVFANIMGDTPSQYRKREKN